MTRIKICGITNVADAQAAVVLGADALGVIGVPNTPRYVSPGVVEEIRYSLPPLVPLVAVVRRPEDADDYLTEAVQYYEEGDTEYRPVWGQPYRYIRVFRIRDAGSLAEIEAYKYRPKRRLFHLDAYHEKMLGGAGVAFDWSLAVRAKEILGETPLMLAGGLTPENVAEAVRTVRPYAVDVSSGVEATVGRKDHEKLRAFINAVRSADREGERTP
jgi:phosphoribosylanthranilate isomerase